MINDDHVSSIARVGRMMHQKISKDKFLTCKSRRIAHRRLMTRDSRISLIQTIRPKRCELLMHDTDRSPHPALSSGYGRCLALHLRSSARLLIVTSTKPSVLPSFFSGLCLTLKHRHRTLVLHPGFEQMLRSIIKYYLVLKYLHIMNPRVR